MWRSLVALATAVLGEGSNSSELKSQVGGQDVEAARWDLPVRDKDIEWQLGGWGGSLKIGDNRTCSRLMNRIRRQCSRDGEQLKTMVDPFDFVLHDLAPVHIPGLASLFVPVTLVVSLFLRAKLSPTLGTCIFRFLCFQVFVCWVLPLHGRSQLKHHLLIKDFADHFI